MPCFICVQCGTQYPDSASPPQSCPVCVDQRQYVRWAGQAWTTLEELQRTHKVRWEMDDGVIGIGVEPHFGIGQRALLHQSSHGNILWDCVSLVTNDLVARIKALGGVSAIAISHPHYYTTMNEWSEALGAPIYIHEAERSWVRRPSSSITFWSGETLALNPDATLIRCGGHYDGAQVMHVKSGAGGAGAVYSGDVIQVMIDRAWVSFMWSFPNYVPLGPKAIRKIEEAMAPFAFERIHGAFWNRNVTSGGKQALARSIARYLAAIRDEYPD
ncbi:MBL fold metallo-hydrolase [Terrarubrum flagellatum]|uniref:MBL fold metallo-hydrolase n=1 Tax=Terrirubrum flagellatum TaxID=2895980 RepID=UPI003145633D